MVHFYDYKPQQSDSTTVRTLYSQEPIPQRSQVNQISIFSKIVKKEKNSAPADTSSTNSPPCDLTNIKALAKHFGVSVEQFKKEFAEAYAKQASDEPPTFNHEGYEKQKDGTYKDKSGKIYQPSIAERKENRIQEMMKERGISRNEALKIIDTENQKKVQATKHTKESQLGKNKTFNPMTKLGISYRQTLLYYNSSLQWGFIIASDGRRITTQELDTALKEVEEKYNVDRNEFNRQTNCPRCHTHHYDYETGEIH